jgi:hypothetical protein
MVTQHAAQIRLTGQVDPLFGQRRNDPRRRHVREPRLVGHAQQPRTIFGAQCVCRRRAHVDAGERARPIQPRSGLMRLSDVLGQGPAIFESDHSSSPLWMIASSHFDSTSSVAASASALSLRHSSHSSAGAAAEGRHPLAFQDQRHAAGQVLEAAAAESEALPQLRH